MTSAYILIVAVLVMGGVLATLGDRIGTRVGKARLSLFKLRPRNTATVVTIITGSLISASTLGILFGLSESLRDGVFKLDDILKKLRQARGEIEMVNQQKTQGEKELATARSQQAQVEQRLNQTNRSFQQAQTQLKKVSNQASILRKEIQALLGERQKLIGEKNKLSKEKTQALQEKAQALQEKAQILQEKDKALQEKAQALQEKDKALQEKDRVIADISKRETFLKTEIQSLLGERQRLIQEQNQLIQDKDLVIAKIQEQEIVLKDAIAQRENRLQEIEVQLAQKETQIAERDQQRQELEKQFAFLQQQVDVLEQYYQDYQDLRQGSVALLRGQVLSFRVVRVVEPKVASAALDQLLREANRTAINIIRPSNSDPDEPLVQITENQANQFINQIKDGQDYVVRLLSAGNYVMGEKQIQVFADAVPNQVVFKSGDVLSSVAIDASTMTDAEIQQRLDQLLTVSQFRARRAGILGKIQIGDGNATPLIRFIEQVKKSNQPLDVTTVASQETYTAGPLEIKLVAIKNGQVIFSN
ncbi:DUF3084 domain-containing protein [Limnofasciculus baicalensis]|uniref:DUF3084 domain-containing protein n=1 Tax=Limnofasciculus baicalensis BBK-W-15 TaxID=2699891 RepID=A0AAE3GQI4_9CYAN|nr:DUF3084 domain-containing protein [Limnofasciculus baicalensis]MCP2728890.1 DUF3084 domain-containing protein [Limnofasciculus baicalensis BBK-W-15]